LRLQYPICFALNLAIPTDKVIGAKQVYCASPTDAGLKDTGGKGDEADAAKLQVNVICVIFTLYALGCSCCLIN
jgi:hypothetical protein